MENTVCHVLQFTKYIIHTEKGEQNMPSKNMPLGRIILDYDYISADARRNTYSTLLPFEIK